MKSFLNFFFIAIACIINAKYSSGLKTLPITDETIPNKFSTEVNTSETSSAMTTTASVSQKISYYTTYVNGETTVYPNNVRAVTSCIPSKVFRPGIQKYCYTKSLGTYTKSLGTYCKSFTTTLTYSNTYCYLTTEMLTTTLPVITSPCKNIIEKCTVKTKVISDDVITSDDYYSNQSLKTIAKIPPKSSIYTECESELDTKLCVYLGTSNTINEPSTKIVQITTTKTAATETIITKTTTINTQESTIDSTITTTETIEEIPSMVITEVSTITPSSKLTTTTTTTTTTTNTTTITVTIKQNQSSATPKNKSNCAGKWAQCGGPRFKGPTCCKAGFACQKINKSLSYCY